MESKGRKVTSSKNPSVEEHLDAATDVQSESKASAAEVENELIFDFLKTEYDALVSLYTHTENTLSSTFNFYLTLLTAAVGAIIVVLQVLSPYTATTLSTLGLLLGFAVLLGIITQDSIVDKNVDLAHYALSINLLKAHVLCAAPKVKQRVFYMYNMHMQVSPLAAPPSRIDRLHKRLWWMVPLGTYQLFVSVINSLALTALAVIVIPGMVSSTIPLWRLLVGGAVGLYTCFVAHCIYAQTKFRRGFRKLETTMTGKAPVW